MVTRRGTCKKHQRQIVRCIKHARQAGLLPFLLTPNDYEIYDMSGKELKEEEEENRATKKFEEMMVEKMKPVGETLDQDLKKGEKAGMEKMKSQNVLDGVDLSEYKIEGSEKDWEKALKKGTKGLVSMPSTKKREKVEMKFEDPDEKKLKKAKKMHKRH